MLAGLLLFTGCSHACLTQQSIGAAGDCSGDNVVFHSSLAADQLLTAIAAAITACSGHGAQTPQVCNSSAALTSGSSTAARTIVLAAQARISMPKQATAFKAKARKHFKSMYFLQPV